MSSKEVAPVVTSGSVWVPMTLDADGQPCAQVTLEHNCPWFDGHFPDNPILPAVGQLALVEELLRRLLRPQVFVEKISRARFKRMIRPGERILVRVSPVASESPSSDWKFEVLCEGECACTGALRIGQASE